MRTALGAGVGLACTGALALLIWPRSPGESPEGPPAFREAPAAGDASRRATAEGPQRRADHALASGETLQIAVSELPAGRPLVLQLALAEPSRGPEPRPVRILATDGRMLHARGPLAEPDRMSTRVEIDPEWLTPGRYIVEVKTTERSHFPLRRYALEVSKEGDDSRPTRSEPKASGAR